jgi:peptide/nickel transport system substrate-binding protein
MQAKRLRTVITAGVIAALAIGAAGCADSDRDSGGDEGKAATGGTFIFAGAGDPKNFDPIFNDDGESFRPIRQMYDTLIEHKPGTAELQGGLAESWTNDPTGKIWTFKLRQGVKFHDGSTLDAAAVCANFDRWYNMKGDAAQSQMIYYADVFGGFAGSPDAVYDNCKAQDASTAVVTMKKYKGAFPGAFALTAFSIASPTALKQYDADKVTQNGDSFAYSAFATEHPTGTGAFTYGGWNKATGEITLNKNPDYWGDKAKVDKMIIKVIKDENTRKQELRAGTVQAIDFPAPADRKALAGEGYKVLDRPAFNILYLGINQKNPKLKDLRVRQAIAYALNRAQLVQTKGPGGATVADEFMPNTVLGYATDVQKYDYNLEKAKQLLAEAGATGLPAVHAEPAGDLHRPGQRPAGRRHQGQRCPAAVERRLQGRRAAVRQAGPAHPRLDRRLQRPGQLRRHVLRPREGRVRRPGDDRDVQRHRQGRRDRRHGGQEDRVGAGQPRPGHQVAAGRPALARPAGAGHDEERRGSGAESSHQ